jgi:carboxypeptidase C (cathepsin A)
MGSVPYLSLILASFCLLSSQLLFVRAQIPKNPQGVQTIQSPGSNVRIRYKEPEICETTPGVRSYSGYVDLDAKTHMYFWFFEARNNPEEAPITLWLTGGPGSDSLLAVFVGMISSAILFNV